MNTIVILLAVYFIVLVAIGIFFARKQESIADFFLAGRRIPAWAAMAAVVATETSAVTFIGAPAQTFAKEGDLSFLQLAMGFIIARVILSFYFLPKFFSRELVTIYAYLGERFGAKTQRAAGLFFFATRALASGVRHYAAALVLSSVFGFDLIVAIVLTGIISFSYAAMGGISAVIWTEVLQLAIMILGGALGFYYVCQLIPMSWGEIVAAASEAGKLTVIHWDWSGTGSYTFFTGVLGGIGLSLASHGADQDTVQRLLACRDIRGAQIAMIGSGLFVFCQFTFFLLLGVLLNLYYGSLPPALEKSDEIFPYFAANHMPPLAAGLVIAAILSAALSSTASALNSLSSTTVNDFVMPLWNQAPSGRTIVWVSRGFTVCWTIVLIVIALWASGSKNILDTGLKIPSFTSGSLLAAFLLGIFTNKNNETALVAGMVAGVGTVLLVSALGAHWTTFIPTGVLATTLVVFGFDRVHPKG